VCEEACKFAVYKEAREFAVYEEAGKAKENGVQEIR